MTKCSIENEEIVLANKFFSFRCNEMAQEAFELLTGMTVIKDMIY